jgi:hypothetical protein
VATASAALGEPAFAATWATGRALPEHVAIHEALALAADLATLEGASSVS